MAGMSQDGKTVYIVTVEGGTKESPGVNCIDIANWMLAQAPGMLSTLTVAVLQR